ncbi:MAG: hypothetical protein KC609_14950, partial [Myxococcales bacterium]|nr:hypothetical protein [Myxococcales bacterium]
MARYSVERLFERRVWLPLAAALLFGALFAPGCFRERFRPDGFADGADASGIEGDAIFDGEPGDTSNADAEIDQDVQAGDAVDALDDGAQDDVGDSDDSTPVDALPFLFFGSSLGPPPTGTFVSLGLVRVSSAVGQMRAEQAWGGIPLARGENVTDIRRLVVVNPTGHVWLRSQLRVLSRWRTDDQTPESERPIRWLQVTLEAGLQSPGDLFEVELRYYDQPVVPPADFYDVTLTTLGALTVVDTGVARFVLNPWNPALLDEITIRRYPTPEELVLYRHKPGAGPRLRVDGHLIETLAAYDETTSGTSGVFVDPSPSDLSAPDFEIVESGPLRAVVKVRGHFVDPATKIDCSDNGIDDPIDRFGFTAVLTFRRGHSTVDAQFNVRNECGSGLATFTDQGVTIERASWVFPLDFVATQVVGQLTSHDGGSVVLGPNDATYELAQKKGVDDGSGW